MRYQTLTNCDLQMVGDEFSRKPYALAVQQGSPLKDQFNDAWVYITARSHTAILCNSWGGTFTAKVPALLTVWTTFPKLASQHKYTVTSYLAYDNVHPVLSCPPWMGSWDPSPYDRSNVYIFVVVFHCSLVLWFGLRTRFLLFCLQQQLQSIFESVQLKGQCFVLKVLKTKSVLSV